MKRLDKWELFRVIIRLFVVNMLKNAILKNNVRLLTMVKLDKNVKTHNGAVLFSDNF